jgi:hypothetical protein
MTASGRSERQIVSRELRSRIGHAFSSTTNFDPGCLSSGRERPFQVPGDPVTERTGQVLR